MSNNSSEYDSSDEGRHRPVRLPLEEYKQAGDEVPLEGFNLLQPLQLLMYSPVFQKLRSGSSHAEYEDTTRSSGEESDEGMEEAMDYFL